MAMQMKVETVTPDLAAHYLKRNVDNYRKISKTKVAQYAAEMKAGKWQLNGEGIMFDEEGKLKNGQHRLAAVIAAGIPVKMTIVTGVGNDVTIYDVGSMRTTNQIALASGCGDITRIETAAGTAIVGRFNTVTKGVVIEWLKGHYEELKRAYRVCGANSRSRLSSRTACVLSTYMMLRNQRIKSYEAEIFFKVFSSGNTVGADGYESSPALVARRMFEERYKGNASDKKSIREQTEILVLAMMDFHEGKTRQMNYQLREPMKCLEIMDAIRKEDGLA